MKRKSANPLVDLFVGATKLIVVGVYRVFFGWWMGGLQARSVRGHLKRRVRRDLCFLFDDEAAQFVPNDEIYQGGGVVTLAADSVLLRIAHHHGEDFIDVAPQYAAWEWEPISLVLMALDAKQPIAEMADVPGYVSFVSLSEVVPLLRSRFDDLKRAYSRTEYPRTKQVLERIHAFP